MSANGKTVARSNSSATATPSRKAAGAGELQDGQLSRDGRFRWSAGWDQWVPTGKEINRPPEQIDFAESERPVSRHSRSCLCAACSVAGQVYADYLKARRLRNEF